MECLESLCDTNCFAVLQEKLNTWKYEFQMNKAEANIGRCCELLELNAKIQSQLFKLLGLCAIYGGLKGSETKLRKQLEAQLGIDYLQNGLTKDVVFDILSDVSKKTTGKPTNSSKKSSRNYSKPQNPYKNDITDRLDELEDAIIELSKEKPNSNQTQSPHRTKKKKKRNGFRSNSLPSYSDTNTENMNDQGIMTNDVGYSIDIPQNNTTDHHGDFSGGSDVEEIRNDTYLQGLVGRYNDLFSESRIQAMNILNQYIDDHENNQRILFALVMTSARSVLELQKTLTKAYKSSHPSKQKSSQHHSNYQYRSTISKTHMKNLKAQIVYEMLQKKKRNRYYRYRIPNGFTFIELEGFIDRTIQLFWNFGGTTNDLSLLDTADGELFDEHKYRRSYDSDYVGPFVNHHIWPCLLQGHRVLVKGEACTWSSTKMNTARSVSSSNTGSLMVRN